MVEGNKRLKMFFIFIVVVVVVVVVVVFCILVLVGSRVPTTSIFSFIV